MCTANPQILDGNLPLAGFALELGPDFIELGNSGGPHGMTFTLQSAGGVDRFGTVQAGGAIGNGFVAFTGFKKTEVLDV